MVALASWAQKGIVRGNVFEKSGGQPLSFANVYLSGTTNGAITDEAGFFTIANLAEGKYRLVASSVGYDSSYVDFTLTKNGIFYHKFYLAENTVSLTTVDISAKKEKAKSEVQISKISITPKQIKSLPSIGGEADIAQYLPVLPGIVSTGDQGGQIYIRGGSPIQNKILLDGMTIYNPFHSIGFFSVFETETVRNVDVLTGGFGAEHGGRVSAIVDIKTRDGNKKRYGGIISGNTLQSKILLEGPIIKQKEESEGGSSFLLTLKRSYMDQTSKSIYKNLGRDSFGLPFNFTDAYGKMTFETSNGTKFNFFGFNFKDNVNYTGVAQLGWNQWGIGGNMKIVPTSYGSVIDVYTNYSNYEIQLQEGTDDPRTSSIGGFVIGMSLSSFGKNTETKFGLELNGFETNLKFKNFLGYTFTQNNNTTELSGFIKQRRKLGSLVLEPSLRLQYYASLSEFSFEPRLAAKLNITDWLRFKFAGGLYSQNLLSTVSDKDVVNLFIGFLSGPEETFYKPGNSKEVVSSRLQKAIHAVGGFEVDLAKNIEFNLEPYYKRFTQLININRSKLVATDPNYITETGNAAGLDFSLKYDTKKLYLWATYSLAYVNRNDGIQTYPTIFDRRHNMNFLGTYSFGRKMSWEFSARWNYGSGFPFTLTQGFFNKVEFGSGINSDPLTQNGLLGYLFSDKRNSGRLPSYHRLDLSLKKSFVFSKYSKLELTASVTNAYNRNNIFYFDRVRYKRIDQLPVLPSLGATLSF